MSKGSPFRLILLSSLVLCASFAPAQQQDKLLDQEFQSAVAQYNAGNFAEAAAQLEKLSPRVPKSFEVHELLGLVYAAQSKHEQSVEQLQIAVRLKPDSAAARTNLATSLLHSGQASLGRRAISPGARSGAGRFPGKPQSRRVLHSIRKESNRLFRSSKKRSRSSLLPTRMATISRSPISSPGGSANRASLSNASHNRKTPESCITCSAGSTRRTESSSRRQMNSKPPLAWIRARTTSSHGAASFFFTGPTNQPSRSSSRQRCAFRIRRACGSGWEWRSIREAGTRNRSRHYSRRQILIPPILAVISFYPRPISARQIRQTMSFNASAVTRSFSPKTRWPSTTTL